MHLVTPASSARHCSPGLQTTLQAPQLKGSLVMSTQSPLPHCFCLTGSGQVLTSSRQSRSEPQVWPLGHSLGPPGVLQGICLVMSSVQAAEASANESSRVRRVMVPRSEVPEGDGAHGEGERHAQKDVGD